MIPNKRIVPTLKAVVEGDTLRLNYQGEDFNSRAR
jgi:hypothetical protein